MASNNQLIIQSAVTRPDCICTLHFRPRPLLGNESGVWILRLLMLTVVLACQLLLEEETRPLRSVDKMRLLFSEGDCPPTQPVLGLACLHFLTIYNN